MIDGKRVAVVVPAYDEEELIGRTLASIPAFVDRIYVVDDQSQDATAARAAESQDPRVEVIAHDRNRGVGAAIVTGYKRALDEKVDVTAVMAADGQMDPDDLEDDGCRRSPRRGRLRQGEPALHRPGVGTDAAPPLPRQRGALDADEDRVRLLARRRLAVRLHGGLPADAPAARPRPGLPALRLPERHARPPERLERAGAGLLLAADLQRRRALRESSSGRSSRRSPGCSSRASSGGCARST